VIPAGGGRLEGAVKVVWISKKKGGDIVKKTSNSYYPADRRRTEKTMLDPTMGWGEKRVYSSPEPSSSSIREFGRGK